MDSVQILSQEAFKMNEIELDIIIPVRMPSSYLNGIRSQLKTSSQKVRISFVLDSKESMTLKDFGISDLSSNERFFVGNFNSPGLARNRGLEFADGEFICFWDVDDSPVIETTLEFVEEMNKANASIGIGSWTLMDDQNKKFGNSALDVAKNPGLWRFVFRRNSVKHIKFSDSKWGEDQLFIIEALATRPRITTTSSVLYRYKKGNPDSLTSRFEYSSDLFEVTNRAIKSFGALDGSVRDCVSIILVKQVYAMFKYGSFASGLKSLFCLIWGTRLKILRPKTFTLFLKKDCLW
jgi:glycosyltransferase involved in cell wall biosynthesis